MRVVRAVAALGLLVMVIAIAFGSANGEFIEEGAVIWAQPWGKTALIDLYVGLAFFGGWIALRERSALRIAAWWAGLAVLGNLAAATYLMFASFSFRGLSELLTGEAS